MKCKNCGMENEKDCSYCINCGSVLKRGFTKWLDDFTYLNTRVSRVIFLIIMGVFLFSVAYASNYIATKDIKTFISYYRAGDVAKATQHYDNYKERPSFEKAVSQFFYQESDKIEQDLFKGSISREEAVSRFNYIIQYEFLGGSFQKARDRVIKVDASRACFKSGKEKLQNKQYGEGIEFLGNVVKEDSNYNEARKLIKDNMKNFKAELLETAANYYKDKDYKRALDTIKKGYESFPGDRDFEKPYIIYNAELKNREKKSLENQKFDDEMKEAAMKEQQPVSIINIAVDNKDEVELSVVWKNNSQKAVRSYTFGVYTFKSDGEPTFYGDNYYFAENKLKISGKPGEYLGENDYWVMPEGTAKVKVCIDSVVFEDGTKWESEYNYYWYRDESDKY